MPTPFPKLYYSRPWRLLHEQRDGGVSDLFEYSDDNGAAVYPLVRRPINSYAQGSGALCDIVTPKGFSGPTVISHREGKQPQFLAAFSEAFDAYCTQHHVVCEYVKFNPWLQNHLLFQNEYDISPGGQVFGIDLTVPDIFMDEITSQKRRCIRKARKLGVELRVDYDGTSLKDFLALYEHTISKHQVSEYYRFELDQLKQYFALLKGQAFLMNAHFEGHMASSFLFVEAGDFIHYIYSGTDPAFYHLNAGSLIIYTASEDARKRGKRLMDLGAANDPELARFKKGFTRRETIFDYYVGRRIRDRQTYDGLVDEMGGCTPFFPAYRRGSV